MKIKGDKSILLLLSFLFGLGILCIIFGIKEEIKIKSYEETNGHFVFGQSYSETDSDGNPKDYYEWVYIYRVSGEEYKALSANHSSSKPRKTEEKILYNSLNPSESIVASDKLEMRSIVWGCFLSLIPVFLLFYAWKRNNGK